jgi:hypothetical protein
VLAPLTFALSALLGRYDLAAAASLLMGCGMALLDFWLICQNTLRSLVCPDPGQAEKRAAVRYVLRHVIAAVFLIAVIKSGYFQPILAAIPYFYTKIILLFDKIFRKKGG